MLSVEEPSMSEELTGDIVEDQTQTQLASVPTSPLIEVAKMSDQEKAEAGHALEQQIADDSAQVMARYLRIGRNLHFMAKSKLYESLGFQTFDAWRAQPDLNLSRATSYALMKVFETFIDRLKVDQGRLSGIDWTKLYNIAQFCTPENVDEMLSKAESLSRTDLQREVSTMRALAKGQSPAQTQAHLDALDVLRESCPIGCGAKCGLINADEEAAVKAFKIFLGKYKSLSAKIRSLFGKNITASAQHGQVSSTVPSQDNPAAPGGGSESHVPERASDQSEDGNAVHGQDADGGSQGLETSGGAPGEIIDGEIVS